MEVGTNVIGWEEVVGMEELSCCETNEQACEDVEVAGSSNGVEKQAKWKKE